MATLTSKEKDLIRESWAVLHANKAQNAVAFFVLFFRKNPTYKDKFSHFRDQSLDELAKGGNPKLQVHASSVFDSFEAMVENIDDVAMTSSLWDNTSRRHYVSHGIDFHHFEDMETAFLEILKNKLGAKMTPEIDASWRKLFGIMNVNFKSNAAKWESRRHRLSHAHIVAGLGGDSHVLYHVLSNTTWRLTDVARAYSS